MSDPSLLLQGSIVSILRANAGLTSLVNSRVYDEAPDNPTFPYVTVGDGQVIGDDTEDCGDGSDVNLQIDAWSRTVGYPEVKRIAGAIRTALKTAPTLVGFRVSVIQFLQCNYLRDPDGKTRHAAIQMRYLISDAP